jgi:type I restriction enzyme R subunit
VDARNIRNIVLLRPINTMIEFKQIVGRGTRLFDGKDYFTIYDFVDACKHFSDSEWDGEPYGKEREIQHMIATSFWSVEGKPISAEEFLHSLFDKLPEYFKKRR